MNVLKKAQIILLVITLNFFFVSSSYAGNIKKNLQICLAFFKINGNKKTMSQIAAENGETDVLEFVVRHKIDNANKGFVIAAEKGNINALKFFSKYKIYNFSEKQKIDDSSIERVFEILFKKGDIKTLELLVSLEGIIITEKVEAMGVRIAIKEDNVDILKFLEGQEETRVDFFMTPHYISDFMGVETFIKAVEGGAVKIAEFLIVQEGADPNGIYDSKHPLVIAIENGDVKMQELLTRKGAKIANFKGLRDILIREAVKKGDIEMAEQLRRI